MQTAIQGVTQRGVTQPGVTDSKGIFTPINLTPPIIIGVAQVGQLLTAIPGTWAGSPTISHQWNRGSTPLGGATGLTYTPISADIGQLLHIVETATEDGQSTSVQEFNPSFGGSFATTLGGATPSQIFSINGRSVNHLHESPNGRYISMTSYSLPPFFESTSYLGSYILLLDKNTGIISTVVPPNPLLQNANAEWWPDSKSFVYSSNNAVGGPNPTKHCCRRYFVDTGLDGLYYNPPMDIADFSVGPAGAMVLGGKTTVGGFQCSALFIWDGTTLTQITTPAVTGTFNPSGDVDPQWGAAHISWSRSLIPGQFTIVTAPISGPPWMTSGETTIVPPGSSEAFDGVGCWSGDALDTWLTTWYTDPTNRFANGLYYMAKDGTGRTRINVQAMGQFNDPAFVLSSDTSSSAKVLYSTFQQLPVFDLPRTNLTIPMITGIAAIGNTLGVVPGAWTGVGSALAYQWKNSSIGAIPGATGASYLVQSSDAGATITVQETATNSGGSPFVVSAATAAVSGLLQTLTLTGAAFMVGDPQGTRLGDVIGTMSGSTVTFDSLSVSGSLQLALVSGVWQLQVGPTAPGTGGTITFNLVETLGGISNSPHTTSGFTVIENATPIFPLLIELLDMSQSFPPTS
jgi:hypothetical protein